MSVFATGCTHFGHANIIRLVNRPFTDVEEMNERLIERWNSTIGPRDEVWHLGDFAYWSRSTTPADWLARLNGRITLIRGNHDPAGWGDPYLERTIAGRRVVLFHYPIAEWNGWWRESVHLHAHTHATELVSAPRRFNVGVDATGFTPVAVEDLLATCSTEA